MTTQITSKSTTQPALDAIRQRAYFMWEREGRPQGRAGEFWVRAEDELMANLPIDPPPPNGHHLAAAAPVQAQPALLPLKRNGKAVKARSAAGSAPVRNPL